MKIGDIILIPFPFSELTKIKVRPAVIITETDDIYRDFVVSAVSSVIPANLSGREFIIKQSPVNNLRCESVVKTDRIVTVKREQKIADLEVLSPEELEKFKSILHEMIE
jgi:mRNA interferase MazF